MVPAVALGFLVLLLVMLAGRWFATAHPHTVLRTLKWGGIGLAAAAIGGLIVTGRLPLLLAAGAALVPWLIRAMHVHAAFRYFRGAFGGAAGWRTAGSAPAPDVSELETRYLRMRLDHDSGELDGEVLEGALAGRRLCQLGVDEVERLWRECQADPQSAQVLEAWLDRTHPEWRRRFGGNTAAATAAGGAMSRDEAYAVLGLKPDAAPEEIRAAHRRLMMACHPDHGGSDWLASRLNQAKDMLLDD